MTHWSGSLADKHQVLTNSPGSPGLADRLFDALSNCRSSCPRMASEIAVRHAVPAVADLAVVDLDADGKGYLERVAVEGCGDCEGAAETLCRHHPGMPRAAVGPAAVFLGGERHQLIETLSEDHLRRAASCAEHFEFLRSLGLVSYLGVQLKTLGRVVGVMSFLTTTASGRSYSGNESPLAHKLADYLSFAIRGCYFPGDGASVEDPRPGRASSLTITSNRVRDYLEVLTRQQLKILLAKAEGHSDARIREDFHISYSTWRTHVATICKSMKVENLDQASRMLQESRGE